MTAAVRDRPLRRLRRRLACENGKFRVYFDHVRGPGGREVPDYLVVSPKRKAPGMITGVAVLPVRDGRVGLLRVYRHAMGAAGWEVPRGFVEAREGTAASALRELREETGLACPRSRLKALGLLAPEPGVLAARVALFAALDSRPAGEAEGEIGHGAFRWFDPGEARRMVGRSLIQDPCTLVCLYRFWEGVRP